MSEPKIGINPAAFIATNGKKGKCLVPAGFTLDKLRSDHGPKFVAIAIPRPTQGQGGLIRRRKFSAINDEDLSRATLRVELEAEVFS